MPVPTITSNSGLTVKDPAVNKAGLSMSVWMQWINVEEWQSHPFLVEISDYCCFQATHFVLLTVDEDLQKDNNTVRRSIRYQYNVCTEKCIIFDGLYKLWYQVNRKYQSCCLSIINITRLTCRAVSTRNKEERNTLLHNSEFHVSIIIKCIK